MKTRTITACVIFAMLFCLASGAFAAAPKLTVGSATVAAGGTTTVNITADNATGITGAAFTLTYDTTALDITVSSDFFGTFTDQGFDATDGLDANGKIDGTYDSPLVQNEISTGMMIAAANAEAADGTNKTLFTLNVTVENATEDSYDINITATTLKNEAAGYDAAGEQIDLLIEAKADGTFASLLTAANAAANVTKGTIKIGKPAPECIPGDVNDDKIVDLDDAMQILLFLNGYVTELACDGDVDKSGEIDLDDATTFTPMLTVAAAEANVPKGTITIGAACLKGDANCDGNVTAADALMVLRVEAKRADASTLQGDCDINKDGAITAADALQILRYEAQRITVCDKIRF
jgi:hypothetical protein